MAKKKKISKKDMKKVKGGFGGPDMSDYNVDHGAPESGGGTPEFSSDDMDNTGTGSSHVGNVDVSGP